MDIFNIVLHIIMFVLSLSPLLIALFSLKSILGDWKEDDTPSKALAVAFYIIVAIIQILLFSFYYKEIAAPLWGADTAIIDDIFNIVLHIVMFVLSISPLLLALFSLKSILGDWKEDDTPSKALAVAFYIIVAIIQILLFLFYYKKIVTPLWAADTKLIESCCLTII